MKAKFAIFLGGLMLLLSVSSCVGYYQDHGHRPQRGNHHGHHKKGHNKHYKKGHNKHHKSNGRHRGGH